MAQAIRRVVTGHDQNGKAIRVFDGPASNVVQRPSRPGVTSTCLWQTNEAPARFDGPTETADGPLQLLPPKLGTVLRIVEFEPEDPEVIKILDGRAAFSDFGGAAAIVEDPRHPFMHRTETVDYALILAGSITMLLDDEEVLLNAGDVVIQRGTNHVWSNRGSETCRIAFIMIDGNGERPGPAPSASRAV